MTLSDLKKLCRYWVNRTQKSFLREDVLVLAINDARRQWCEMVGYPETRTELTIPISTAYADASALDVKDIKSVYYDYETLDGRLLPLEREDKDLIVDSDITVVGDPDANYYFYEEVMAEGVWRKRFYVMNSYGEVTDSVIHTLILYYTPGSIYRYTETVADDARTLEIPDRFCDDVKYVVDMWNSRRAGNENLLREAERCWKESKLWAYMLKNHGKKDAVKRMRDSMALALKQYKENY